MSKPKKTADAPVEGLSPGDSDPVATELLASACRGVAGSCRWIAARCGGPVVFNVADGARSVEVTSGERVYSISITREK